MMSAKSPINIATDLGQSLWYDNIERRLLENGEMAAMISRGDIRGVTSNPAIFNNAIAKSSDYDSGLVPMAWSGYTPVQIYEQLAVEDVRAVADLFAPLYRESNRGDGYVSLEVSPTLAYDTQGTIIDAKRLWAWVNRPNLMIKIPATQQGLPAIRQAIAAGINVNVTLIFSIQRYCEVMDAFLSGLEDRLASGASIDTIASVASFFVSRMDTKVDKRLGELNQNAELKGKLAIANAKLAYQEFRKIFESERFAHLKSNGARYQRPLWASTSTKNPDYKDTIYVDTLIGQNTVNTAPPATLIAFKDHGEALLTIENDLSSASEIFASIEKVGISVVQVTQELEDEGVKAFSDAYATLLKAIEDRSSVARKQLGILSIGTEERVAELASDDFPSRLHAGDPSLWTSDQAGQNEIRKRLGWLSITEEKSRKIIEAAVSLRDELCNQGFTHALLLGMGGSSLAPEVMRHVFGAPEKGKGLDLAILDSTDPVQVKAALRRASLKNTLFIVASKSGSTAEVQAMLDYFWAQIAKTNKNPGEHFIAVTDPGTFMASVAKERGFRKIFEADPNVGGRYSALIAFGLVPAVLMGIDANKFLDRALSMVEQCSRDIPSGRNPGLVLGVILSQAALLGRNKLSILADPLWKSFGSWLEQLIAESSGKQDKGILPIDNEPILRKDTSPCYRIFVYLRKNGKYDPFVKQLQKNGTPVLIYNLNDPYDLSAEFYRWEIATAVACSVLCVNAFDQPDVQDNKTRTVNKITAYKKDSKFDEGLSDWASNEIRVYLANISLKDISNKSVIEILSSFIQQGQDRDFIAINAYVARNPNTTKMFQDLRKAIQKEAGLPTTLGFGPRFLHSTGQYHKAGTNEGLFIQITMDNSEDIEIPGQGISFGTLERAQALGDFEALQTRGRRLMRIHFSSLDMLKKVIDTFRSK
ncbi:MAG: bifunctional transaldolase/phosoglucose isomerase [Chloroflexota bacterium]